MGRAVLPVSDLATWANREHQVELHIGLIDGDTVLSLDMPPDPCHPLDILPRVRPHSAEWEFRRVNHAAGLLPAALKYLVPLLWQIYYHGSDYRYIARHLGIDESTYYRGLRRLQLFFLPLRSYFARLE